MVAHGPTGERQGARGLRLRAVDTSLAVLAGVWLPTAGAVLTRNNKGETDKFGARPSAAADVGAGRLILLTCCFWSIHNRRTHGRVEVVATRQIESRKTIQ